MEKKPHTSADVKNRYAAKTYDTIRIQVRKDSGLLEAINRAADAKGVSRQAFIVAAIEAALNKA